MNRCTDKQMNKTINKRNTPIDKNNGNNVDRWMAG